ncbi:hypothetical protein IFM89_036207 [Coptis chinensis]|uniref:HXXXD-type acyl-transferase family protein n=1 Tax=Coptis chinensis TaxID=261450 RepID=A0A835IS16_9MAGN|nr:hypothetical protein IFM89_036207 [Coptis chinensis]
MGQGSEVRRVSSWAVKPHCVTEESQKPCYLTPWDLAMLSVNYIQKGLLFTKPPDVDMQTIIEHLKDSLSRALTHFFPLSGRLVTKKGADPPSYHVVIDCTDAPGAEFIHAVADLTVADITSAADVPPFVESFFAFNGVVNHDGHTLPLLAVQVTELLDGYFVGCSINHSVADGTSFWHFFNTWSEISARKEGNDECISRPPITKRWFMDNQGPSINLPFSHHDEFIERYTPPLLRERMFHFSAKSIAQLKARANSEQNTNKISSFQALSAFVWKSITQARLLPADQNTSCRLAIDNRSRLHPPLCKNYFGNCIQTVKGTTTAGELLANNLGWSAWLLNQAISAHDNNKVCVFLEEWVNAPLIYQFGRFFDVDSLMMGSSPKFDMYNNFGWGKPVAARSGYGAKFDGKVSSYPGCEGGGSVDVEVCLPPKSMDALLSNEEFMDAVSVPQ